MRVAALYDIHGNLPALEAVLTEVNKIGIDQIVVGGDVLPGPMPNETLKRLMHLDLPVHFIHGNGELAILEQITALKTGSAITYWGTTSGKPPPEADQEIYQWTARQLEPESASEISSWQKTFQLEIEGLGTVLFCHATPRSETELFTRLTPEDHLIPLFENLTVAVVICGHTHMQFDRQIGNTRVVNAGSVGESFGDPGAYWALLGPDIQLKHTSYNLDLAVQQILATSHPQAQAVAQGAIHPPSEEDVLEIFRKAEL